MKTEHVKTVSSEQVSQLLIRTRPDLWGLSRALKHNKGSDIASAIWKMISDEDQKILIAVANGRIPESWNGEV